MSEPSKPQLTDAQLNAPLRKRDIEWITKGYACAIKEFVHAAAAPLVKRIEELERRPNVKYCGVYEQGRTYREGELCTDHGSIWHANRATMSRPGESSADWTLAVKKGRDADERRITKSHR